MRQQFIRVAPYLAGLDLLVFDQSGLGDVAAELLPKTPPQIGVCLIGGDRPLTRSTQGDRLVVGKSWMMQRLGAAMRSGALTVAEKAPGRDLLRKELAQFVFKPGARGQLRLEAARGHDDPCCRRGARCARGRPRKCQRGVFEEASTGNVTPPLRTPRAEYRGSERRSRLPFQEALGARTVPDYPLNWEAIMWFRTTGIQLLGAVALAASATAQTPPAPSAITRTVVAATKLPTVTDVPLYFRAVGVTLPPGEKSGALAANGILYQISGSTEISVGGETRMLSTGEGLFIAAGKTATLKAGSEGPSTFLHFFLVPAADLDRPAATAPAAVRELYRTVAPIPDLKPGGYDLNLTRVTFPAQMPSNPPHHRSGAALYYIISGTGANTVDGKTEAKGPGSLIYEPFGLVHQWGNPGNEPFTFLAFNINPEGVAAVLPGAPAKSQ